MEKTPQIQIVTCRIFWLDQLRGIAILLMILFHLSYDLNYFHFISIDIVRGDFWIAFRALIVTLFLFAVGVSLVLVHREGIRWNSVWRRAAVLGAAAGAVSLATWWIFPRYWVYFGILHLIWVVSLLGLPFIGHPRIALSTGVFILPGTALGWLKTESIFQWLETPLNLPRYTVDLAPLFPWFAVVLFGVYFASLGWAEKLESSLPRMQGNTGKLLTLAGRHSLSIYLLHQPILFGGIWVFSFLTK